MTIALTLKVNDSLILAADSASTLVSAPATASSPPSVVNVYNNALKISNLRKGLPIGLITWGLGGLSGISISTLAKDLRQRFMGQEQAHKDWHIDPASYSIAEMAARIKMFILRISAHFCPTDAQRMLPRR